jgi:RNA polymerase sigma-70 factor (ECF subfamily)
MTRKDLDDEELARAAKAGDVAAFGILVERHQRRVYGFMLRVTRRPATAEDLAQEAFLKAWRGLRTYDPDARFAPWLNRIGVNLVSDWASDARRSPIREWDGAADAARDEADGPEERAGTREAEAAVHRQILELPGDERQVVLLRHVMGLSYAEVADATGQPLGTVKTNLFRARARLKAFFDHLSEEPCVARK